MNDPEIGGIPFGIRAIKIFLPLDKKGREKAIRPMTLILTYFTYMFFNAARRPLNVTRIKILEECNGSSSFSPPKANSRDNWCSGTVFEGHADEITAYFGSLYIAAYAVSEYISGVLADSFNPRYMITAGGIMVGFFSVSMGLANLWKIKSAHFFAMVLIMLGVAQSTAWPVLLSCTTHWYSSTRRRGLFFALWNTHAFVGGALGTFIAAAYVEQKWGWSFLVPGFIVALMSLIVFLLLVVHPADLQNLDARRKSVFADDDSDSEIPTWMDSSKAIDYYEALKIPGVIEYSGCMFFSRMVSYINLYWHPLREERKEASTAAYFSIPYALGGILGGVITSVLKDRFHQSALVCISFLLISIPVICLQIVRMAYTVDTFLERAQLPMFIMVELENWYLDSVLLSLLGIFVEGPFILLSTSVSVDLGTHSIIRRGHRGLATVASIIEGTGAVGATLGPLISNYFVVNDQWIYSLILMVVMEFLGSLCLVRMAYKEYSEIKRTVVVGDRWGSQLGGYY